MARYGFAWLVGFLLNIVPLSNAQETIDLSQFAEDMRISCCEGPHVASLGQCLAGGDVNGDGYADIVSGAEVVERYYVGGGAAYIIFGGKEPRRFVQTCQNDGLVTLWGNTAQDYTGYDVEVFDFDKDGLDDVFVSATQFNYTGQTYGAGKIYYLPGRREWPREILLQNNPQTPWQFTIRGQYPNSFLGYVLNQGDFNGDGFLDLMTAAGRGTDAAPRSQQVTAYVVFGGQPMMNGPINELNMRICRIYQPAFDWVSTTFQAGDLDADGFTDLFLAFPEETVDGVDHAGIIYIVWGRPNFPAIIDLKMIDPSLGITTITSDREVSMIGGRFAVGDFNGNGFPDVSMGYSTFFRLPDNESVQKQHFRVFYDLFRTRPKNLSFFDPSLPHITVTSSNQAGFGYALLFSDWDLDGADDLVFSDTGAQRSTSPSYRWEGCVYLLYGKQELPDTVDVSPPNGNFRMTTIWSGSFAPSFGFSLATADINGDGPKDLIIGAETAATSGSDVSGEVYVLLNKTKSTTPPPPDTFKLSPAFPNPFNVQTGFRFDLHKDSDVQIRIIDSIGRVVRTVLYERLAAGEHWAMWNTLTDQGRKVASGLYFVAVSAGGQTKIQKVLLLK